MFICLVTNILLLFLPLSICLQSTPLRGQVGIYFEEVLNKKDFFTNSPNSDVVIYSVGITGLPDMPKWMKLEQNTTTSPAFIYGTPSTTDVGTKLLRVVAWNKETYKTTVKNVNLTIIFQDVAITKYQLEFKIKNKNMNELFNEYKTFLATVQKVWFKATHIVKLESAADRLGKKPLPGSKEGVYVLVGGSEAASNSIDTLIKECSGTTLGSAKNQYFLNQGYKVDWCSVKRSTVQLESFNQGQNGFTNLDMFVKPKTLGMESYNNRHEHLSLDVVYLFIPVVIGLIFVVVLTCVVCFDQGYSEKVYHDGQQQARADNQSSDFSYGQLADEGGDSRSSTPNHFNASQSHKPPDVKTHDSKF